MDVQTQASIAAPPQRLAGQLDDALTGVLDSAHEAYICIDADGQVLRWNRAAETTFGFSREEAIGRRLATLIIPERSRAEHDLGLHGYLATGQAPLIDRRVEVDVLHRDGHELPIEMTIASEVLGEHTVFHAFLHDIAERRVAEASARELAAVVHGSADAIMAGDLDGTITRFNPGAERLYGHSQHEMIGRSFATLRPDGTLFALHEALDAAATGRRMASYETEHLRADGTLVEVSVMVSPLFDASGQPSGLSMIARDVGERRKTERALREASRRFEQAFVAAPSGMALVDRDGRWLAVNGALCRFLGRDEAELLRSGFPEITHPDDLAADLEDLRRTLSGELDGYEMEKRYLLPDGAVVWGQLNVSLVRDDDGAARYFISQIQDITQRKEAEEELLRYTAHLSELARRDPLTGLRNLREFHALVEAEIERGRRHGTACGVVLFDVEQFRAVNAQGGHSEGDRVLREVAAAITAAQRGSDHAVRLGADEFALILADTSADDARRTGERIVAEVRRLAPDVALVYGTASWPQDGESKELVLVRADMQLQAAKADAAGDSALGADPDSAVATRVERILSRAREQLGLDVAWVTELTDDRQIFRAVSGDAESFGLARGTEMALDASYCHRMVQGAIGNVVPDTAAEPELAQLPVTHAARVGAYVGVPLALSDGAVYGALCCAAHDAAPGLSPADADTMRFLATLVVDEIEAHVTEARARRSQAELAGVHALLSALIARDHYTGEHSKTVVDLAVGVARRLDLPGDRIGEIEQVALLHDIGKVGIPDAVLQKRGPLTESEWELMRQHPAIGARILAETATLAHLAGAVRAEHERFDGTGYPDGLRGEEIPLASRIGFACDAFHAMTSDRPYRAALPLEKACAELREGAGTQFDPKVVEALLAVVDAGEAGRAGGAADRGEVNVLDGAGRRTTAPLLTDGGDAGSPGALGEARGVCRRCGTHVPVLVMRATVSGSCGNCGSYELDLV